MNRVKQQGKSSIRAAELLDIDMKALCFEENDKLDQTEYTQAALVTVWSGNGTCAERERGLKADVTAGLSLGEYCAIAFCRRNDHRRRDHHSEKARHPHAERSAGRQRLHGGSAGG